MCGMSLGLISSQHAARLRFCKGRGGGAQSPKSRWRRAALTAVKALPPGTARRWAAKSRIAIVLRAAEMIDISGSARARAIDLIRPQDWGHNDKARGHTWI